MEQITKKIVMELLQGGKLKFKFTQGKICIPIINRLYLKMLAGIKFSPIQVADGLIIDGHHRYLAALLADFNLEKVPSNTTSVTTVVNYDSVELVEEDWDTEAKIKRLNEEDARYNGMELNTLLNHLNKE